MAAPGAFVFPDKAKLNFVSATDLIGANAANFKIALVSSAWTPANSTDEVWADVSANEIANGNGYTTGGLALTGVTLTQTAGTVKFTGSAAVWTASGAGIAAWRRGVVYYSGTLNAKVNPVVGHFLGDSAPADVPVTTSGNTLTITPNASGILTIT
ncbi:MAG: hypothetical protein RL758_259 [Pseudomonadota bacterium]|jgi:hypothetical protein